jgi:hypothetical protein
VFSDIGQFIFDYVAKGDVKLPGLVWMEFCEPVKKFCDRDYFFNFGISPAFISS